ncbi:hypothetical protein HDU91_005022, partial [Kappamyces sp. JEL0680]
PVVANPVYTFCEPIQYQQLVHQPTNAWSSLTFNMMGMFLLTAHPGCKMHLRNVRKSKLRYLVVFCLGFLGLASWYFHAALNASSYYLDFASTLLPINLANAFTISRWTNTGFFYWILSGLFVVIMTLRITLNVLYSFDITLMTVPTFIVGFYFSEYCRQYVYRKQTYPGKVPSTNSLAIENVYWLNSSFTFIAFAFICWSMDNFGHVCLPFPGGFQLHAIWHANLALAVTSAYLYMCNTNFVLSKRFKVPINEVVDDILTARRPTLNKSIRMVDIV